MKQLVYSKNRCALCLHEERVDGYLIIIMNYGTHPCGYIGLPKNHFLNKVNYNELADNKIYGDKVNGGFTYSNFGVAGFHKDTWFLGWDYAHFNDYTEFMNEVSYYKDLKKWTAEEIYQECLEQLEEIKKIKYRKEGEKKYYIGDE